MVAKPNIRPLPRRKKGSYLSYMHPLRKGRREFASWDCVLLCSSELYGRRGQIRRNETRSLRLVTPVYVIQKTETWRKQLYVSRELCFESFLLLCESKASAAYTICICSTSHQFFAALKSRML